MKDSSLRLGSLYINFIYIYNFGDVFVLFMVNSNMVRLYQETYFEHIKHKIETLLIQQMLSLNPLKFVPCIYNTAERSIYIFDY